MHGNIELAWREFHGRVWERYLSAPMTSAVLLFSIVNTRKWWNVLFIKKREEGMGRREDWDYLVTTILNMTIPSDLK